MITEDAVDECSHPGRDHRIVWRRAVVVLTFKVLRDDQVEAVGPAVHTLEAVLADPRAAGPDAIVVGGDVVPGAFAGAALDRLQALSGDVHWVRGNGERETAAAVNGPRPAEGDNAAEMSAFTARQLGPERARALGELPLSVIVDGVLFCHATPRSDEELVTRISPPEHWSEVLTDMDAALVVAGHTHQQDDRMVNGVRFVNAGSVGLPYEGDGDARWLWIEDGVPELRRTA